MASVSNAENLKRADAQFVLVALAISFALPSLAQEKEERIRERSLPRRLSFSRHIRRPFFDS